LGNGIYIHNISCQLDNGVDCSSPPVFLVEDATASEWSSDGNYIVCNKNFVRNKARIVDIAEPERTVTLVSERFCANPHWSPTRNRIVVSCEVDTNTHTSAVYTVNADGSNLIQLTDPKVIDFREVYPRWSPDGDKLVFNSIRDINLGKDVCGFGCSDSILTSALYIMDVDGSNIVRLSLDDDEVILGYTWVP
jgi:Tol biopolymer transport system component